ncbi:MAG: nicotinate-nucleotide adenylyltransferase [Desulfuromonadaceae bacterium]|nr:nicotinate-nucleotide adenylyltransferase [Desulfuromonadaceae bacterium]
MRTGIFGGSFDPIHRGHLTIAHEMMRSCELDRILFIPAPAPPHKTRQKLTPFHHRLAMTRLAVADCPAFSVSDLEAQRQGKSYSIDTLRQLHRHHPEDEFFLLIGMDSFLAFDSWKNYADFFPLCHLVVALRPGSSFEPQSGRLPVALAPHFCYDSQLGAYRHASGNRLFFLEETFCPVSSTEVRQRLKEHRSVADMIPAGVLDYIVRYHLYSNT